MEEAQAGLKIAGRNVNNLRYTDDTTLMAESEEELKSLFMKVKEEIEKFGLKLNIQKTKIMASSLITSCQIDGETVATVADFMVFVFFVVVVIVVFLAPKITADGVSSHEIKRHFFKESYYQPRQGIKKQKHYFVNKGPSSQGYGFSSTHV